MPQRTAIWTVSSNPAPLIEARLPSEELLEEMIVAAPRILSDEWMLIRPQGTIHSAKTPLIECSSGRRERGHHERIARYTARWTTSCPVFRGTKATATLFAPLATLSTPKLENVGAIPKPQYGSI